MIKRYLRQTMLVLYVLLVLALLAGLIFMAVVAAELNSGAETRLPEKGSAGSGFEEIFDRFWMPWYTDSSSRLVGGSCCYKSVYGYGSL